MSCCESNSNATGPGGILQAPKRNHYYFSKMMDVLQFDMEQAYHNRHRRTINRLGIGTGVLCGLGVEIDDGKVCVRAGVALDVLGREVTVPGRYCIDPWSVPRECGEPLIDRPRNKAQRVTLCLGYHECLADYAPVMVTDCRNGEACEAGAIVESFKLWVRDGWPEPRFDLCNAISDEAAGYEIVATIDTGGAPRAVAASHDGRHALVLDGASPPRLLVLDLRENTVSQVLTEQLAAPLGGVSIAPDGGPALVTHGKGIVVVNLENEPAKIVDAFNTQRKYGACVATHGGSRLYAVSGKAVYRIDVASRTETKVFSGSEPSDLAVTADNARLVIADRGDKNIIMVDTATDAQLWAKVLDASADTVAAAGDAQGGSAWALSGNSIRRFDPAGLAQDLAPALAPVDSAFSSNGARLYVASKEAAGAVLVVIARNDGSELARIALPGVTEGVAVVPNRWRALATHPESGAVSVVDAIDLRTRLCRALSGPCPDDDSPCIVLATFELMPDGSIGKLDACTHRTRLLSNEMLLELILCLAARQDACCDGVHPTPQPKPPEPVEPEDPEEPEEPEEPERPVVLTRIESVQFLRVANNALILDVVDPTNVPKLSPRKLANAIRVKFDQPIDHNSVTTGSFGDDPAKSSVLLQGSFSEFPQNYIPGKIEPSGPREFIFRLHPEFADAFRSGEYRLMVFCDKDPSGLRPAVTDAAGRRVDGETNPAFPSGRGDEGGDFRMKFLVS